MLIFGFSTRNFFHDYFTGLKMKKEIITIFQTSKHINLSNFRVEKHL